MRVARVQWSAALAVVCLAGSALVLPAAVVFSPGMKVFWSGFWGLTCYVVPAAGAAWLMRRNAAPSAALLVAVSVLKLLGAGMLLALVLAWSAALLLKVVVAAFVLCAVCAPVIAAAVAARSGR